MKRILALLLSVSTALGQVNVQKASGTNEISGSLVVGSGKTLTPTGTGIIIATGGTATTVPWSGVTGTPTTLAGYGITSPLLPTVGGTGQSTWTLGDFLYANGTNTLAKLAGNTSATLAVLTQIGTGTVSAAPVWTSTTGTGNIVRATSPTLVTPILGAATATTLNIKPGTNISQLTLEQNNSASNWNVLADSSDGGLKFMRNTGGTMYLYLVPGSGANIAMNTSITGDLSANNVQVNAAGILNFTSGSKIERVTADGHLRYTSQNGVHEILGGVASTNTTSGTVVVTGGVGVSGAGYFGGNGAFGPAFTPQAWGTGGALDVNGTTGGIVGVAYNTAAKGYLLAESGGILVNSHAGGTAKFNTSGSGATTVGNTGSVTTINATTANIPNTTLASSSTVGALTIGNGTAVTNVAIGGGQVAIGGGNLSANAQSALTIAPTITPINGNIYGLKMDASTLSGASFGNVNPVAVSSTNTGTTNVADQTVFQSVVNQSATSGNISNVINYRAANALLNAGTVSNLYGFRFADTFASSTGVVANQYAFYADAMTRGTVNNYAFYSAGSTPSYFGGNVTVGGTSFQVLSSNSAKTTVDNSGSSSVIGLNSNTAGNYRSLKFSYGATPTTLWQVGYQGATANTNLNFEPSDPSYVAAFTGTAVSTSTNTGALVVGGGVGVAGAGWFGGTVNSAGINVTTGSNVTALLKSSSGGGPYLYLSSTNAAATTATIAGSDFISTLALSATNVTASGNFGAGGVISNSVAGTATTAVASFLQPALATGAQSRIYFGRSVTAFESGEIAFNRVGAASTSNTIQLGFPGAGYVATFGWTKASFAYSTPASNSYTGSFVVGDGATAATNTAIGGGNINTGGTITNGGLVSGGTNVYAGAAGTSFDPLFRAYRSTGGSEWLDIVAANGGAKGNNQYSFDVIGTARPIKFRRSTDNVSFTDAFTIESTGAATFAGAVTTSGQANFQSSQPQIVLGAGANAIDQVGFVYTSAGRYVSIAGNRNPSTGVFVNTAGTHAGIDMDTGAAGSSITFRTSPTANTLGAVALTLASTGAATFAGPVRATRLGLGTDGQTYRGIDVFSPLTASAGEASTFIGTNTLTTAANNDVLAVFNSASNFSNAGAFTNTTTASFYAPNKTYAGAFGYGLFIGNVTGATTNYAIRTLSGLVSIGDSTPSTLTTNGAFTVSGGVGIAGQLNVGSSAQVVATSSSRYGLTLAHTWNNAATAYEGLNVTVTDTASASTSVLARFTGAFGNGMTLSNAGNLTVSSSTTINNQNGYGVSFVNTAGGASFRDATFSGAVTASGHFTASSSANIGGGTSLIALSGSNSVSVGLPTAWTGAYGLGVTYASAVSTIYYGDGTGYSLDFKTRSGGVNTSRMTLTDTGALTVTGDVSVGGSNGLSITKGTAAVRSIVAGGSNELYQVFPNTGTTTSMSFGMGSNSATAPYINTTASLTSIYGASGVLGLTVGASGAATFAGSAKSTSPSGGIGYGTGAGAAVTQLTSKATTVVSNFITGKITTAADALAKGDAVSFTFTNSRIEANDVVMFSIQSGATAGEYNVFCDSVSAGSCRVSIKHYAGGAGGSLSEALVINYVVIKGASS